MDRIARGERKAFVVISPTQAKIWKGDFDRHTIPQTIYERRSIPKTFTARNFSVRDIQRKLLSRLTLNLEPSYCKRISKSLAGAEEVFLVAAGKRRNTTLTNFTDYLVENDSYCPTIIHTESEIDAEELGEKELLAIARRMAVATAVAPRLAS